MYELRTKHGNVSRIAKDWSKDKHDFVHGKNGTATVVSIPIRNLEGVFAV